MKSGLTPLFSDADIDRWFDKFQERAEERIFKLLSAAGEKFVEVARKSGNYTDRTPVISTMTKTSMLFMTMKSTARSA